jgi:hypothetical protein
LVCVAALAALIGAGLLLSSSASHSSALNGEPSSVPTAHALPSLSPSSAAIPTSGPVTYVRAGQWTSTKDQANGGASITLAFYVTVVPGDDLSSGTLTFALYPAGSSEAISPQAQASPSGPVFAPQERTAQSFWVSFAVPSSISSGAFVVSIAGGAELYRQQLYWIDT